MTHEPAGAGRTTTPTLPFRPQRGANHARRAAHMGHIGIDVKPADVAEAANPRVAKNSVRWGYTT